MQFEDWEAEGEQGWLPYSCGPLRGVQAQALGRSMLDAVPTVPAWQAAGSSRSRGESLRVSEHRAGYLVMLQACPTGSGDVAGPSLYFRLSFHPPPFP